jgi:hypothetical protein
MSGESVGETHAERTRKEKSYFFYIKHHRPEDQSNSQWSPEVTQAEEFAIFDDADWHDFLDERQWLYGIQRVSESQVRTLGTWGQQMAEFPHARENESWHGYPLWPLRVQGPENRRGDVGRPSRAVFLRMEAVGRLTPAERKRLFGGKHI